MAPCVQPRQKHAELLLHHGKLEPGASVNPIEKLDEQLQALAPPNLHVVPWKPRRRRDRVLPSHDKGARIAPARYHVLVDELDVPSPYPRAAQDLPRAVCSPAVLRQAYRHEVEQLAVKQLDSA